MLGRGEAGKDGRPFFVRFSAGACQPLRVADCIRMTETPAFDGLDSVIGGVEGRYHEGLMGG